MSIKVMNWVWENSKQEGGALLTLLAMADFADDSGVCWPSASTLARKARLTPNHIFKILRQLKSDGEIKTMKPGGGRQSSTYMILIGVSPVDGSSIMENRSGTSLMMYEPSLNHQEPSSIKAPLKRRAKKNGFQPIQFESQSWEEASQLKRFLETQTTFVGAEARRLLTLDYGWWDALASAIDAEAKAIDVDLKFIEAEFANMKRWMLEPGHKAPTQDRVLQFVGGWLTRAAKRRNEDGKKTERYLR